jgi:hypothetical protein
MKPFPPFYWFTQKKRVTLYPSSLQTWDIKTGDWIHIQVVPESRSAFQMENFCEKFHETENFRKTFATFCNFLSRKAKQNSLHFRKNAKTKIFVSTLVSSMSFSKMKHCHILNLFSVLCSSVLDPEPDPHSIGAWIWIFILGTDLDPDPEEKQNQKTDILSKKYLKQLNQHT